jgi:hypothetical protein
MKKYPCIIICLIAILYSNAQQAKQQKKLRFSIGPEVSLPTYNVIGATGIGGSFEMEYPFSQKLKGVIAAGYTYFGSDIQYQFINETNKGFSIVPVTGGLKYFFTPMFYMGIDAGVAAGVLNSNSNFLLSSSAGFLFLFRNSKRGLRTEMKFRAVLPKDGTSVQRFPFDGGYSFISIRTAYSF